MKKGIKRLLLAIAVILFLFAGSGLYYCYPMLSLHPVETGQISGTNIFAVRNRMGAVYFVKTDSGIIMIDAGSDRKKLEASMEKERIEANEVRWIFLTHSDFDHVAALNLFPNAAIHMGRDELPLINGTAKRNVFGGNTMPPGINIEKIILLQDNQELSLGGTKVKCINAPGHTNGSMAYLVDGKYLFTGDAFKVDKGAPKVHPYTMDAKLSEKTMTLLKETINGSSLVLTAHYGCYEKLKF